MGKTTMIDPDGVEWTHDIDQEQDGDGFWYDEHYAISQEGERRHLGWSRFGRYSDEHFKLFVEAGMPKRDAIGNWSPDDIMQIGAD